MKNLIVIGALLISSTSAVADYIAVGAANADSCEDMMNSKALRIAEAQALEAANKECQFFRYQVAVKAETRILSQYRGSCWAGSSSGIAIEMTYTCK